MNRKNIDDVYPLSPLQEGMLFHAVIGEGTGVYVTQLDWSVRGRFDADALQRALRRVVERHSILRTFFAWEGFDRPVQIVRKRVKLGLDQKDLRGSAPEEQREELRRFAEEDRRRGFDLTRAPLLRLTSFQLGEHHHHCFLLVHHILVDGWSMSILIREIRSFYEAFSAGREIELPEARPYGDFIAWLGSRDPAGARGFFKGLLAGVTAPTPLGVDSAPRRGEPIGDEQRQEVLSARTSDEIAAFARAQGVTVNTVVQGAFALLLSCYSGEEEVLFGATVSGRSATIPGIDRMVGLFINAVPVLVRASPDRRVGEWLVELQRQQIEIRDHEHTPLVGVQAESEIPRGTPLFESLLVFENYPLEEAMSPAPVEAPGNEPRRRTVSMGDLRVTESSNYPLTFVVAHRGRMSLKLAFDRRRFDSSTIARMLRHLQTLIEGLVRDPDRCLGELPLLDEAERASLLLAEGASAVAYPTETRLHSLIEAQVDRTPDAIALVFEGATLSYRALDESANRLAHRLRSLGVAPDGLVAVCLPRSLDLPVALLAVLKAGGAYLPLDPSSPHERTEQMLQDSRPTLLLCLSDLAPTLSVPELPRLALDALDPTHESPARPPPLGASEHLAYVLFTSGSTGRPKAVMIPHRALVNHMRWMQDTFPLGSDDAVLQKTPISFDASVWEFYAPLISGARLVLARPDGHRDPAYLAEALVTHRITVLQLVPSVAERLVEEPALSQATSLRRLFFGGEVLRRSLADRFWARLPAVEIINLYGPTEVAIDALYHVCARGEIPALTVPIGRTIANVQAYVLDTRQSLLPAGVPGELALGGAGVGRGYLNQPDLTAERFLPNPFGQGLLYRTGDRVRALPSGELTYLGRLDQQVKIRGHRIEPGEVTAVLRQHAGVRDAVVVAREHGEGDTRLCAYVIPAPTFSPGADELRSFLRAKLPEPMVPWAFVLLERFPQTPSGKLDVRALPTPEMVPGGAEGMAAPRSPVEEALVAIFAEVLHLPPETVGARESFFALGGHSLLATQAISRIRRTFGVELPLRALFDSPSPVELGMKVEEALRGEKGLVLPPIVKGPPSATRPLSFAQERLWFLDQLTPSDTSYTIPAALMLTGALDHDALGRALSELVRRHETLRTTFGVVEGRPVQILHEPGDLSLPSTSLTSLPEGERRAEAGRLLAREAALPFDLERGPLFRPALITLDDKSHLLMMTMHHIVSDAWSMGVLQRELATLYGAFRKGAPSPLPELPIQYADYGDWQRRWLEGEVLDQQLAYWTEALRGAPEALELPLDHPRPQVPSHRGARAAFALSPEVSRGLHALAREQGVTLFMLLLTAFDVLLHLHTGQETIVVGTPIAGRSRVETESLIGFFVNTLVLRADLDADLRFTDLLARVRETCLGAYAHADLPFERLVQALAPVRDLGRSPLFQVMFTLHAARREARQGGEARSRAVGVETTTAKFDLTLTLHEGKTTINGSFEYALDLFEAATIDRMIRHFHTLLAEIVNAPSASIHALPLLDDAERRTLLVDWNQTTTAYPREASIQALFEAQVDRAPEAFALCFGDAALSYRELDHRANQLARGIHARTSGREVPVGIHAARSLEMIIALLAILKAGCAYVPLDPDHPPARLRFLIEDAGIPLVLSLGPLAEEIAFPEGSVLRLDLEKVNLTREDGSRLAPEAGGDHLAYLMYTSGSTGVPKGVRVPHRSVVRLVKETTYARFSPDEVFLALAPLSFDASTFEIWGPLLNGGTLVVFPADRPSLESIAAVIRDARVSTLWLTASLFNAMIDSHPDGLAPLRQLLIGGEALSVPHVERALRLLPGVTLINGYGPTEGTTFSCCHPIGHDDLRASIPIGRPIANTVAHVLDAGRALSPIGVPGELWIGGDGLALGYLNQPELTAQRFVPDPFSAVPGARLYRTGDRARRRATGEIEYLGRVDDQVKLRGYRIEPGEIASVLRQHGGVRDAVVVAREHGEGDKRLWAYVIPAPGSFPSADELRAFLRERLPERMVPWAFVLLERFPQTLNGKLDVRALPTKEMVPGGAEGMAEPRSPVEEALVAIFAEVLHLPPETVGARESFFALGGHSLLATQAISRIRRTFGVELPLRALFDSPSPAELGPKVDEALRGDKGLVLPPLVKGPPSATRPLSFAQERLWFLDQLTPGDTSYTIPAALMLEGALDKHALGRALSELVRRHETLRTTFGLVEGRPVQILCEPAETPFSSTSLAALPEGERRVEAGRLLAREAALPFDLERGPLFRPALITLDEKAHLLMVTMHHIVSDAWSMGVLQRELSTLYDAFRKGDPSPLAELPIQYADYGDWQRRWLEGEVLDQQLAYWTEALRGAPEALDLPLDHPRPQVPSHRGARAAFALSPEVSRGLHALAREQGVTLFMLLLAAFDVLLHRHTGQETLVVGTPVAGRSRVETESLIGFFVNTLVLRADLGADLRFTDLLARVRETCLGAYAHADLPFERLVQALAPARDLGRSPLFQVMFTFHAARREARQGGEARSRAVGVETTTAKFDLTLTLHEGKTTISGSFEYALDLFEAATIDRMIRHFQTLLAEIVNAPSASICALPLLDDAERRTLLVDWNQTATAYPREASIQALFEAQVDRAPEAIALRFGDAALSYRELDHRANQLARGIHARTSGREVPVGIHAARSLEMIIALLAILKAGCAYVPLDPDHPPARLRFLIEDAGIPLVLSLGPLAEEIAFPEGSVLRLDLEKVNLTREDGSRLAPEAGGDHLAYLMYTSGSTGVPKGVRVPHRAVVRLVKETTYARFSPDEVFLALAPLSFDASTFEIWGPLLNGGSLVVFPADRPSLESIAAVIRDARVSTLWLTASLFNAMIDSHPEGLAPLRQLLIGGEALSVPHVARALRLLPGVTLVNGYGPTEGTTFSCCHPIGPDDLRASIPIGRPIANTVAHVLDAGRALSPIGVPGELWIGGDGLALGYLNQPELTALRFVPDPFSSVPGARLYRTGDRARRRATGEIEYLGRVDDQVKVRGYRIELGEIEAALAVVPGIREAVVALREDQPGDKRLVAYLVFAEGASLPPDEIRSLLRRQLPMFMVPSAFVALESLPRMASGKLDRRALPAPEGRILRPARGADVPRDEIEAKLVVIWRRLLKVSQVGIRDSFFDLGGHSILAVQMVSEIKKVTGRVIPLIALFEAQTIEQLAVLLRDDGAERRWSALVPVRATGARRPLFMVSRPNVNALGYVALGRHLDPERPLYVLQYQYPEERTLGRPYGPDEYAEWAARYLELVRGVQPEGPYLLAGMCEGAHIAFDMVRLLEAEGQQVALLAVLDAWSEMNTRDPFLNDIAHYEGSIRRFLTRMRGKAPAELARQLTRAAVGFVKRPTLLKSVKLTREATKRGLAPIGPKADDLWIERHFPGPDFAAPKVSCDITVFRVKKQPYWRIRDERLGWGSRSHGAVTVRGIAGEHETFLREPHVRVLAEELGGRMNEVETKGGVK